MSDWVTVYTVTTKQGDFVANRYDEAQSMLLMKTCDHTRPENSPHQVRTWHDMETQTQVKFAAGPVEGGGK